MTVTYTWQVTGMKTTAVGSMDNYIVQTYWKKIGTDENGNTGEFAGATPFQPDPTQTDFTPLAELTEEDVLGWIKSVVVGHYAEHVDGQIARALAEKASPVVDAVMPWAPPAPPTPEATPA